MSKSYSKQVSIFSLEGRFLGFEFEDGYKRKYLRMATAEGECRIKLCKQLQSSSGLRLILGDWVEIFGEKTFVPKSGKLKLKAERVTPASPSYDQTNVQTKAKPAKSEANASIMVCQKSSCMKRGGKAVCQALAEALGDRGLADKVAIKGTGCMKQCKAGPNLVMMPDKTRYSRVQAAEIPKMIDKHFATDSADEEKAQSRELTVVKADSLATVK